MNFIYDALHFLTAFFPFSRRFTALAGTLYLHLTTLPVWIVLPFFMVSQVVQFPQQSKPFVSDTARSVYAPLQHV